MSVVIDPLFCKILKYGLAFFAFRLKSLSIFAFALMMTGTHISSPS